MPAYQKRSQYGLLIGVMITGVGLLVVIFLVILARSGGPSVSPAPTPGPRSTAVVTPRPKLERSAPELVYQRTVEALKKNDATSIYSELSPGLAATFSTEDFLAGAKQSEQQFGPIVDVRVVSPPMIKSEAPWNGEWADAKMDIIRKQGTTRYLIRLHREGNEWWLFGTLEIQ